MSRFSLTILIVTVAVSITVSSAIADSYYYTLDSAISISISDRYIAIQFDSNVVMPQIAVFQAAYDCLSEDSVEYIDRSFWAFPLAAGCSFAAAAEEIAVDSAVGRVFATYRTPSDSAGFRVTDKIIVQFEDDIDADSALAILAAEGLRFTDSSAYRHNLWRCALAESITSGPIEYGNRLHERPETRWAYAAQYARPVLMGTPSDSYFANQYYLKNTGQNGGTPGADIAVSQAWDVPLADSTYRVAVMDDGITEHLDLPGNRIFAGRDFVGADGGNPQEDGNPSPGTYQNHGMACAGMMAASHNDTGVVGVFGSCEIVPIKIFDDGGLGTFQTDPIVDAIYYAQSQGVRVISNSWGYVRESPLTDVQAAIRDVANGAGGSLSRSPQATYGTVFVFAAGNYAQYGYDVLFPANMPEVIAVGASDKNDSRWSYSCTGSALDLMAPSGNAGLQGDQWTIDQEGTAGWNPFITGSNPDETDDIDYTAVMGGTSGACPQVAGIAALLMARGHGEISNANPTPDILEILENSAIDLGATGWDDSTGFGRANAYRAMLSIIRGDVNNDAVIDALDINVLADILFFGGHATLDDLTADVNCDLVPDALDMNYLIDVIFFGGPPPPICFDY